MRNALIAALAVSIAVVTTARAPRAQSSAWNMDEAVLPPGATPRPDALELVRGIAVRRDVALRDGVIDFELGPPAGGFAGLAFRMASTADYEIIYFNRSEDGTRWKSVQYQPVFQGETTWQLYYRDGYRAVLPVNLTGRLRVHLAIAGRRADVSIAGLGEPILRIRELKREPAAGAIGFWVAGPDASPAPVAMSGLQIDGRAVPALPAVDGESAPATQIVRWHVSPRMDSPGGIDPPVALPENPDMARWAVVAAEASGVVNLTRAIGNPAGPQRVNVFGGAGWGMALAHVRLDTDAAVARRLSISYSDGVGVYLNGRRLFTGINTDKSRYADYLGVVGAEVETLDLPLRSGANDLVLAVTDRGFGWGFRARLDRRDGLRITPQAR